MSIVSSPSGPGANARPYLHGTELAAIGRVLETGQYGHGPETDAFELELAAYLGVDDVVAVATGTAALHLALLAAGVGHGDEVVVPSLTFCASVQAILATGARPRFADIDPGTLCVTPAHIEAALTPETRAVMPVLYGGRAVDLGLVSDQLADRDIAVVEDAAHAFGSLTAGRRVGAAGELTCFSFDAIKALTCGDGGAIVPRTPADADWLRGARLLGMTAAREQRVRTVSYQVVAPGFRYHLSTLHAAIGRVQLANFDKVAARRQYLWRRYATALTDIPRVSVIDLDVANTVPFNCVVRIPAPVRDAVHARLHAAGIQAGVHYPPNHLQPAFARWSASLPATESVAAEILSLPFHPDLTDADVDHVAASLSAAIADEHAALDRSDAVTAGPRGGR